MLVMSYQPGHGKECVSIGTLVRGDVVVWMKTLNLIVVIGVNKLRRKRVQRRLKIGQRCNRSYVLRTAAAPASTVWKLDIASPGGPMSSMRGEYIAAGIAVLEQVVRVMNISSHEPAENTLVGKGIER
jgi:hypothetical protein